MTPSGRRDLTPSSSLDHVIEDNSTDTFHMRLGMTVAVLAHVVLFVANWPSIAGSAPKAPEKQLPIVVLRHFEYKVPPTPLPEMRVQQHQRRIQIPDPDPDDAEVFRDDDAFEPIFDPANVVSFEGLEVPAPPPDVVEPTLIRVGGDFKAPRRIVMVEPIYPEIAIRARKEGVVILSLIIGVTGRVESVEVLRGLPLGLTEAAVTAARQWVFEPSTYNGKPTAVLYNLTVHFNLS
ncbi:MAG: TonB family protein [Acidobacteriota bacterium]